jgi:hypothetical protein
MTETKLYVKGAQIILTDSRITVIIPKDKTQKEMTQMKNDAINYLFAEDFINGPKTREIVVERI